MSDRLGKYGTVVAQVPKEVGLLGHNDSVVDWHVEQIALGAIHEPLTESELNGGLSRRCDSGCYY